MGVRQGTPTTMIATICEPTMASCLIAGALSAESGSRLASASEASPHCGGVHVVVDGHMHRVQEVLENSGVGVNQSDVSFLYRILH